VGHRVLVVDDEPMLRVLVARGFRLGGHEVVEAADGLTALDIVRSASEPFDLVVTNSKMPHLDGAELARRLRELSPTLPIIHLSGSHGAQHVREMPPGVPTLFKPFDIWELVAEGEKLMDEDER
jgi:two-component system, OmpR family, response regulator